MANEPENNVPQEKKKNTSSTVILIVVILAIIGIVVYSVVSKNDSEPANKVAVSDTVKPSKNEKATEPTTAETTTETTTAAPKGIVDISTHYYNIVDSSGYYGSSAIIYFDCQDDFDGYEVIKSWYEDSDYGWSESEYLPKSAKSICIDTEGEIPTVYIRTYKGDPKSKDAEYGKKVFLCSWDKGVNETDEGDILKKDWDELIKDSY